MAFPPSLVSAFEQLAENDAEARCAFVEQLARADKLQEARGHGLAWALSKDEARRLGAWREQHDLEKHGGGPVRSGAIGGRWTFSFTPTNLGTIAVAACSCGDKITLTDFDTW